MNIKRSLLIGATVATITAGVGGVSLASAATANNNANTNSSNSSSIVDRIAARFHLNKSDVQAVFDENRQAHQAQMETEQKQKLADAVAAGKLTQAQADHITSVMDEIKTLQGNTAPRDLSQSVRDQIKAKLDDLRQWAKDNNVSMRYVMGMHARHGMHDMGDMDDDMSGSSSSSTNTSTSNNS